MLFADLGERVEQPTLACADDGTVALVFVVDRDTVHLALREPKQAAWSAPRRVAVVADLAVGMHRGPRIAWAGDALLVSYVAARFDRRQRKVLGPGDLMVCRSTDRGRTWSEPRAVNGEHGSAAEGLHALAARRNEVVLAWLDPRGTPKGTKLFVARSHDGGSTWDADAPAYASPSGAICECCHPSACIDTDGAAVLLWRNHVGEDRDMFVGRLPLHASAIADANAAGVEHWKLAACPMDGGALALAADGRAVSVWRREDEVFVAAGEEHEVRLGAGHDPTLAIGPDAALAVWESGGELRARRVTIEDGARAAAEYTLGAGRFAAAAAMPGGRFLVVAERQRHEHVALVTYEL